MKPQMEEITVRILWIAAVFTIVSFWHENNILNAKVNACDWEIGAANYSIQYANEQLNTAHGKAWADYQTMGSTLGGLYGNYEQRPNPCDKDYDGNLNDYPKP